MMNDNCKYTTAEYQIYSVAKASLLWCGVSEKNIDYELGNCTAIGGDSMSKATLRHPTISCLEPRMRAIFLAIDAGLIPCTRENGRPVDEYVAYDRRHVYGKDLKEWAKRLPKNEQPKFLMTTDELKPEISHEIYARLKAEYDTLKIEHSRIKEETQNHNYAIGAYKQSLEAANKRIEELEVKQSTYSTEPNATSKASINAFFKALNASYGKSLDVPRIIKAAEELGEKISDKTIYKYLDKGV